MGGAGNLCRALLGPGGGARAQRTALKLQTRGRASAATAAATRSEAPPQDVRPYEDIPGLKALPIIGNAWRFLPGIGSFSNMDFLQVHYALREQFGNIVKLEGLSNGRDMIALYDPVDIEKVYRHEGVWPKREAFNSLNYYRRNIRKDLYEGAYGLLTTNEKEWQDFRRKVQGPMLQPRAVAKYTGPIDQVSADFIERLREIRGKDNVLPEDAANWFFRWALESIATISLDTRLGCLDTEIAGEPQQMIDAVQVLFEGMYQLDLLPSVWRYVSTPMWRKYVKAIATFETTASKYIQSTIDHLKAKVDAGTDLGDDLSVLEKLLLSNDNPRVASTMALDMLFAGIDTTSFATAALLYLLSRNPDKQEELFKELKRVLPNKDTPVTAERIAEMNYLRAVMKESLRMKTIAIGQMRENTTDGLVIRNYRIKKGIDIVMLLSITGNDSQYVPQADRFLPERWIKGHELYGPGHPFAILPFGFGPRICIGKRFAELEIQILNAKLLRNFRVEYPRGEAQFETRLLHYMSSPMTFKLIDRD